MKEEATTDITSIDEMDFPVEPPEDEKPAPNVPSHLVRHPCGLPQILMDKKQLTQYEQDHGIKHEHRKELDVQEKERELYEIYSQATRNKRATKDHFVAALRLFNAGFKVHPEQGIDLNDMKVM